MQHCVVCGKAFATAVRDRDSNYVGGGGGQAVPLPLHISFYLLSQLFEVPMLIAEDVPGNQRFSILRDFLVDRVGVHHEQRKLPIAARERGKDLLIA